MTARFIVADVFDGLAQLDDDSVDLVFSSPPFLALRSYLPADHPDKAREIGSEPTPAAFLDRLLDVVEACDRVLAPHGSLVFELGDTYSGSGGAGGDYNPGGLRDGQSKFDGSNHRRGRVIDHDSGRRNPGPGWPLEKSLCGIPTLFAWSLAYGRNLLRPERVTSPWRVRNLIAWCRPNPPVGALGDKVRPATSYLTVACKSRDRYFDLDAVRTHDGPGGNVTGAPPLDYWVIPTEPYEGAHYATFPRALVVKPVKAMCPQRVCTVCGEPSRRIVDVEGYVTNNGQSARMDMNQPRKADPRARQFAGHGDNSAHAIRHDRGWTDCGCPGGESRSRAGVVLDPFAGSGTTLAVATGHGRDAIGIDLDERNAELALERVGPMFLDVELPAVVDVPTGSRL